MCQTNETNVIVDQRGRIYATFEKARDVPAAINVTCGGEGGIWKAVVSDQDRSFATKQFTIDINEETESSIPLMECNFTSDEIILADSHVAERVQIIDRQTMIVRNAYDVEMGQNSDVFVLYSLRDKVICRVQLLVLDKNDWTPLAVEFASIYIGEDTPIGTQIGQVKATDFDLTSTVSYVLLGEGKRLFPFRSVSDLSLNNLTFNRV